MDVGLVIPNTWEGAIDTVRRMPQAAEAWGYDAVWVTDHVIGVKSYEPVYGPIWAEALTSLAYVAGTTSRIRLGVGVMVVPYRNPVYAAKVLATVDQLSDGRLILGVGTGWSRSEYHALGVANAFEQRGAVTDESLDLMLKCWAGGELAFEGEFFAFRRIEFEPASYQRPHPPIWVGGQTGRALRRAAKYADVWHPTGLSPEDVRTMGERLDEQAGRAIPRSIRIRFDANEPDGFLDRLAAYRDAGCIAAAVDFAPGGADTVWKCGELLANQMARHGRP
jgi:probable F420-dependent oxidoreductase